MRTALALCGLIAAATGASAETLDGVELAPAVAPDGALALHATNLTKFETHLSNIVIAGTDEACKRTIGDLDLAPGEVSETKLDAAFASCLRVPQPAGATRPRFVAQAPTAGAPGSLTVSADVRRTGRVQQVRAAFTTQTEP